MEFGEGSSQEAAEEDALRLLEASATERGASLGHVKYEVVQVGNGISRWRIKATAPLV
jgi:hypothetical protein